MTTATVTLDSKDLNRIEIFMSAAYQISEGYEVTRNISTARLAYWNMSLEAQTVAAEKHQQEFGTAWYE